MKKTKFYLLLSLLLSLVLVGCGTSSNIVDEEIVSDDTKLENTTVVRQDNEIAQLRTDQNVMVFSTISSAAVLSEEGTDIVPEDVVIPEDVITPDTNVLPVEPEIDMDKANSYLLMMENLLADGGPVVSSETASDRDGYDYMMVITFKDLAGNSSTYTLYYSIIVEEVIPEENLPEGPVVDEVIPEENEGEQLPPPVERKGRHGNNDGDYRTDNDDKSHNDYDEESYNDNKHQGNGHGRQEEAEENFKHHEHGKDYEDKDEIEYAIKAIAVIGDNEYEVLGKKEVEEDEVEIEFIIKLDEQNFVKIEQEIEDDEIEYKYTIYKDGKKYSSLKFETENENGKTHIKLTTEENGFKETYKFIKEDAKTVIKYDGKGYSYTLVVTSSVNEDTGEIIYNYYVKEKDFSYKYNNGNKYGHHKKH